MTLDQIRDVVRRRNSMPVDEWMAKLNPPGEWVYTGKGPSPDKHPTIPGTKPGPRGIELLPANDGTTYVPVLTDRQLDELEA